MLRQRATTAEHVGTPLSVVVWGTYDLGKPRVRILLRGLRENGILVHECHSEVWGGIEDKSQVTGILPKLGRLARWLASYPGLIWCYLRAPRHDAVLVPYMGQMDVLVLWPFAKLRRRRIVWDAFISLYNTIVEDRGLVSERHPLASLIYAFEWLATRAADHVLLDTEAHAGYFARRYALPPYKLASVFVGAEPEQFPPLPPLAPKDPEEPLLVLFYGQFIPLHGISTIIEAARLLDDGRVHWVLIGKGQKETTIRESLTRMPVRNLEWHPWVPYEELIEWIGRADVCLGIFSASGKAAQVIPNKVFQVISAGRPLVTRDSPAIRELLDPDIEGIRLVPAENPAALATAIEDLYNRRATLTGRTLYADLRPRIATLGIGKQLRDEIVAANA